MNYQVLARKWRPKLFKDVIGQNHITQTLKNSILKEKIAHAYLLTGTRGIGKTSIARIFAKAIRCENLTSEAEPCLKCPSCTSIDESSSLDYLEVDGASNNSVDDIRTLVENVQYLPSRGAYKVYVIDEVHMLSISAFNALLKTLEEPPEHVVFIFATTDPQKLLGTVISRCQRLDFKNSNIEETTNLILNVAKSEGIELESDSIAKEIAKQGHGSIRDSLSLFDQIISLSDKVIDEKSLLLSLGMARSESVDSLVNAVFGHDKEGVEKAINDILSENIDLNILGKQCLDRVFQVISDLNCQGEIQSTKLAQDAVEAMSLIEVIWLYENLSKDLEWAINSFDPEKTFKFVFIKAALRKKILTNDNSLITVKKKTKEVGKVKALEKVEDKLETKRPTPCEKEVCVVAESIKTWDHFMTFVFTQNRTIGMNLERGNLLSPEHFNVKGSPLKIAFSEECRIFYDYLTNSEVSQDFSGLLQDYLEQDKEDIQFSFEIINDKIKLEKNFKSTVEIEEEDLKEKKAKTKEMILQNKYIKDAQTLFDTTVDKVILN